MSHGFDKAKAMLDGSQVYTPFPLINAVISGAQNGKIYFFGDSNPTNFFTIHKSAFSYLYMPGTVDNRKGFYSLIESDDSLPQYFHVYDAPTWLIEYCTGSHENFNCKLRTRIQLKYTKPNISMPLIPQGYSCTRVSTENIFKLATFELDLANRYWKSESDFLQNGFGYFIQNENGDAVSLCYSACVENATAEIDVATMPDYRNRGLAKTAVAAFIQHCLAHNIIANWDCFEENAGSLKTAYSLGFDSILVYPFLSIFNKMKKHENHR